MKKLVSTITQRGQVTIPVEVRRLLGLKPRDRVAFEIGENEVKLVPVRFTLESAYGSVPSPGEPQDFKKLSRRVKEARAEAVVRSMQKK